MFGTAGFASDTVAYSSDLVTESSK